MNIGLRIALTGLLLCVFFITTIAAIDWLGYEPHGHKLRGILGASLLGGCVTTPTGLLIWIWT